MNKSKFWIIAPLIMAVTFLAPSCNKSNDTKVYLNDCTWDEIKTISKQGKARECFKIGDTKDVAINERTHKVRIIGFNQDKDKDGNKIGITFEFVNLISDKNGFSLATYWHNTNQVGTANYNYMNSTIRAALNGNDYDGSSKEDIHWFQFFGLNEDSTNPDIGTNAKNAKYSDDFEEKSVLSMLPEELANVLATPSKIVNVYNGDQNEFSEVAVNDKLFLLSPREMDWHDEAQEASTLTYEYYEDHSDYLDSIRIKHQALVGYDARGARTSPLDAVEDGNYAPAPGSPLSKHSFAGFNSIDFDNEGGTYWLRSPEPNLYNAGAWSVYANGSLNYRDQMHVYDYAKPVAPAFCI